MTEINQNVGTDDEPIFQGDDIVLDVTVTDDEDNPFNLSGATVTYTIRQYPDSAAEVTKTVGSGVTIVDAANGNLKIEIDSTETETLYGDYVHRCIVNKDGEQSHVFVGDFKVDK